MILKIIVGVLVLILLFCIFFMWLKNEKIKRKELEKQLEQTAADTEKIKKQTGKYVEVKKENEELVQQVHAGNKLDSADASIELLQKLAAKGKKRNKN